VLFDELILTYALFRQLIIQLQRYRDALLLRTALAWFRGLSTWLVGARLVHPLSARAEGAHNLRLAEQRQPFWLLWLKYCNTSGRRPYSCTDLRQQTYRAYRLIFPFRASILGLPMGPDANITLVGPLDTFCVLPFTMRAQNLRRGRTRTSRPRA
jgi:hypothetical protein